MNQTNEILENNNQDKLWNNAFNSCLSNKSQKQLLTLNKQLCDKIVEKAQNKNLKRKTGSYRTMYKLEYLVFWYFEDKIEKAKTSKDKHNLYQEMRHIIKVINQELDNPSMLNETNIESESENKISSNSDSEYEDDEFSESDYDSEEESIEEFKKEVYNMNNSDLDKSLEFRYLSLKGTRQDKIIRLLDFGPELPKNLTQNTIERIVNKYKTEYLSESDDDYEDDSDCDNEEKNEDICESDSDSDSDYEPFNYKKHNC